MNFNLRTSKEAALENYKQARANVIASFDGKKMDNELFIIFEKAKRTCRQLGVIV